MMLPFRLGCPMSLKTPNMGNPGFNATTLNHDFLRQNQLWGKIKVPRQEQAEFMGRLLEPWRGLFTFRGVLPGGGRTNESVHQPHRGRSRIGLRS